jgi:hypothetical protein
LRKEISERKKIKGKEGRREGGREEGEKTAKPFNRKTESVI